MLPIIVISSIYTFFITHELEWNRDKNDAVVSQAVTLKVFKSQIDRGQSQLSFA